MSPRSDNYTEMMNIIFYRTYPAMVSAADAYLINLNDVYVENAGIGGTRVGVTDGVEILEVTGAEDHIIAMFQGHAGLGANADEYELALTTEDASVRNITIDMMVELYAVAKRVDISGFSNVVEVYNHLSDYIAACEEKARYSLTFKGPPKEDMAKMVALLDALEPFATYIGDVDYNGKKGMASLLAMFETSVARQFVPIGSELFAQREREAKTKAAKKRRDGEAPRGEFGGVLNPFDFDL